MATTIYTPVEGFTGVIAGVAFADGVADADLTPAQRHYFVSQGYGIDQPPPVTLDSQEVGQQRPLKVHVGSLLADAAAAGLRRVTVLVDGAVIYDEDRPEVEVAEFLRIASDPGTDGTDGDAGYEVRLAPDEDHTESPTTTTAERPKIRDSINVWRSWVISQGGDPDWVGQATKDELQAWQPQTREES